MIRIVTPFCDAADYLPGCLTSVRLQTARDWHLYLLDDCSADDSIELAERLITGDKRFTLIRNDVKQHVPGNYCQALARPEIDEEDIIVCLDGDDELGDRRTLDRVLDAYADGHTWLTWGSYYARRNNHLYRGVSRPVADVRHVRQLPWSTSHLRTFKAFLFRQLADADLRAPNGQYWEAAGDLALMFPMLEMAGNEHAKFLVDINYIYTADSTLSDAVLRRPRQLAYENLLREKPPYPLLER